MPRIFCMLLIASNFIAISAFAGTEWVYVRETTDDNAIVERSNGDSYLIEKGVGCLSLWRMEGKQVLIDSPGLFLGVGTRLLIPDLDQECRVWESKQLTTSTAPSTSNSGGCEDGHWIKSVSNNGAIIVLEDGSVWEVSSIDRIYTSIWLPISNITICGSMMINLDEGENVSVTRIS